MLALPVVVLAYRLLNAWGSGSPALPPGSFLARLARLEIIRFVPLEVAWLAVSALLLPLLAGRLLTAGCGRAATRCGA
ncbi:hypothetical protein NKH77_26120 [Streptomyces sp. M19]